MAGVREHDYPFVASAEERARSARVAKWWLAHADDWESTRSQFDREWSVSAIERRRREEEANLPHRALDDPTRKPVLTQFHSLKPNGAGSTSREQLARREVFARLMALVLDLLGDRPPRELPGERRRGRARMILFAERAMSDQDLVLGGLATSERRPLAREWVRWAVNGWAEYRQAWAERVDEALSVLKDAPPQRGTGSGIGWQERALAIIFGEGRTWPVTRIADHVGVSRSTLYRNETIRLALDARRAPGSSVKEGSPDGEARSLGA